MRKKITIKLVRSIKEYTEDLNKRIEEDKIDKPETGLIMTPETFAKVFSPERIKLLKRIHNNSITNIYQLAKELNKPYEVVFRNIKYFEGLKLISLKEKNHKKIPTAVNIEIDFFGNEKIEA